MSKSDIDILVEAATPFANLDSTTTNDRYLRTHGNMEMSFTATAFQLYKLRMALEPFLAQYHEFKEGDTLEKIAHQYLGDSELWPEIYDLNGEAIFEKQRGVDNHCRGPDWVVAGTILRLPSVEAFTQSGADCHPKSPHAFTIRVRKP